MVRWKRAWIIAKKDLSEFKKQKLVIGSIIAMPLVLGVVLPLIMFVPIATMAGPIGTVWDIQGLIEIDKCTNKDCFAEINTNQTFENIYFNSTTVQNMYLKNAHLQDCVIMFCIIENSTINNSTVQNCSIYYSQIENTILLFSEGIELDGKNILAVNSSLTFTKTKESETAMLIPFILNYILVLFVIIPATLPTIIASYSIVGEKNNRSLEPILATPTTDAEILAGKILSSFIPSMGSTLIAFFSGAILIDVAFFYLLGYLPLPTLNWILVITLLAPTASLMSILALVLVSSKVTDVRAAQQIGGFVIMPVIILMLGVISGFIFLSPFTIILFSIFYSCIDLGLFYFAKSIFNREDILTKWA